MTTFSESLIAEQRAARAAAKAAETPKMTCPCCFGSYKAPKGLMSKHGYKAPGRGSGYAPHVGGSCFASGRFEPLEVSPKGTLWVIEKALADMSLAQDRVKYYAQGATEGSVSVKVYAKDRRLGESMFRAALVTREEYEAGKHLDIGRPTFEYSTWAKVCESRGQEAEYSARAAREFALYALEELVRFHPTAEVPAEVVAIRDAARAALLAKADAALARRGL